MNETARAWLAGGGSLLWTVPGVLSPAECTALIHRIDALGPTAAPVTTFRGPVMRPDVRNNERVMFDDKALARTLFERVLSTLPPVLGGRRATGANERLRCYRYRPGQKFAPHLDGAFRRNEREESELTLMVYLNDDFEGGHTTFHDLGEDVAPRAGTALLFFHRLRHEGCEVTRGTKYVVRSDVMYAEVAGLSATP